MIDYFFYVYLFSHQLHDFVSSLTQQRQSAVCSHTDCVLIFTVVTFLCYSFFTCVSFLPFIDQFALEAKVYGSMEGNVHLSVSQFSLVSLIQTEIYQQLGKDA